MQQAPNAHRTLLAACIVAATIVASLGAGMLQAAPPNAAPNASTVEPPPTIAADEPLATRFSALRAAQYLDRAAQHWQTNQKCAACHTMVP